MDKRLTGIVAYLTIIGWIIAFLIGDKKGAKFHLNQALVIGICGVIGGLFNIIPVVGWIIGLIIDILVIVGIVIGIIGALQGEEKEVPILGGFKILN